MTAKEVNNLAFEQVKKNTLKGTHPKYDLIHVLEMF